MAQDTVTNLAEITAEVNALDDKIDGEVSRIDDEIGEVNSNLANCIFSVSGTGEDAEYFMQIDGDPTSKKPLGASSAELLWTNPDLYPDNNKFLPQTISIPESINYKSFIVEIRNNYYADGIYNHVLITDMFQTAFSGDYEVGSKISVLTRQVTKHGIDFIFSGCFFARKDGYQSSEWYGLIPTKIYGLNSELFKV